jgi:hypothetical protein
MAVQERAARSPVSHLLGGFFDTEIRAWRGEEPLWKVFWFHGVLVCNILAVLYGTTLYAERAGLQQVLLVSIAAYTAWVLIAAWRCADNTQQSYWGVLARHLIVVWAGNTVMLLPFLEIDAIERLLGS